MASYDVYLELGEEGGCVAHVLALPGCYVVGSAKQQALDRLPEAILAYHRDMLSHGDEVSLPEQIELQVIEVQRRSGLFHPDDRAALFEPERRPLTTEDVTEYFRLAALNRLDLLSLVRGFSDGILDWKAGAESMSIRQILYHIGRGEQWYISRISGPSAVALDWRTLPAWRYLELARADAHERFRSLSEASLGHVSHPAADDGDRSEAWTVRKALRRLLEHEREHTAHINEVLGQWRRDALARLAAARSRFIWQFVSLDERALVDRPLYRGEGDGWTARDLMAHVADWDLLYAQRTALAGRGRVGDIKEVNLEERNAALTESTANLSLEDTVQTMVSAREQFLTALGGLPDADMHRRFRLPWGRRTTLATWTRWRARHDVRHTRDLLAWRESSKPAVAVGPKSILMAALESGRQEMLATAALVAPEEWATRPLYGVWTLKDVLGHVADWEWYGVEKLGGAASRRSLDIRFRGRIQAWNEAHAAARRDQPWEQIWSDFQAARLAMGRILEKMSQDDLGAPFAVPWSKEWTVYHWLHLWLHHEREHAAGVRATLSPPAWPALLKQFE